MADNVNCETEFKLFIGLQRHTVYPHVWPCRLEDYVVMGTLEVLWFFLAWALFFQEGTAAVDYCNPEAPLTTGKFFFAKCFSWTKMTLHYFPAEYFVPFYEESRTVKGCFSSDLNSDNGFKVVVVRTKITSGDVLLTLAGTYTQTCALLCLYHQKKKRFY